jgi:hypothetical protein
MVEHVNVMKYPTLKAINHPEYSVLIFVGSILILFDHTLYV